MVTNTTSFTAAGVSWIMLFFLAWLQSISQSRIILRSSQSQYNFVNKWTGLYTQTTVLHNFLLLNPKGGKDNFFSVDFHSNGPLEENISTRKNDSKMLTCIGKKWRVIAVHLWNAWNLFFSACHVISTKERIQSPWGLVAVSSATTSTLIPDAYEVPKYIKGVNRGSCWRRQRGYLSWKMKRL